MGLIFGAGGLLALNLGKRRRSPSTRGPVVAPAIARIATAATPFTTAPDSLSRLERLDHLRRQGSLTEAEFQTLKAKIVEDG